MAKDSTQPKQPPGRPAWARGSKFKLLESHLTDWEQARAQKRVSAFYDRITTLFVVMYGYDLPLKQDGPRLCEENEVNIDAAPTVEGLTQAEALARSKYHKKVRDILMQWYLHHGQAVKKNKNSRLAEVLLDDVAILKPRKKVNVRLYQKQNWKERIKPRFDLEWAALKAEREEKMKRGEEVNKERADRYGLMQHIVQDMWDNESDEVKAGVDLEIEEDYQKQVEAKEKFDQGPQNGDDYDVSLLEMAPTIQSVADLLYRRLGLVVAIFFAGPSAELNGDISVKSVHTGHTTGVNPMIWPDYDPDFDKIESSMVRFAANCYTQSQRAALTMRHGQGSEDLDLPSSVPSSSSEGISPVPSVPQPISTPPPVPPTTPLPAACDTPVQPTQPPASSLVNPSPSSCPSSSTNSGSPSIRPSSSTNYGFPSPSIRPSGSANSG
ncbi:hypothetical protein NLI96_g12891 [Meripilus lineatus]|uniref:Uncharacterized protein n=1 Tax=Meripilus lineatus TaxID=2056292 RepID=A0AAD5Y7T0_9APHY|nr:hypothetical protein NLI96_g12891 [Physisporinus lineatus]